MIEFVFLSIFSIFLLSCPAWRNFSPIFFVTEILSIFVFLDFFLIGVQAIVKKLTLTVLISLFVDDSMIIIMTSLFVTNFISSTFECFRQFFCSIFSSSTIFRRVFDLFFSNLSLLLTLKQNLY